MPILPITHNVEAQLAMQDDQASAPRDILGRKQRDSSAPLKGLQASLIEQDSAASFVLRERRLASVPFRYPAFDQPSYASKNFDLISIRKFLEQKSMKSSAPRRWLVMLDQM